jgi:hypothetical protein
MAAFEQGIVDPWIADHPVRDLTFVRIAAGAIHGAIPDPRRRAPVRRDH